MSEPLTAPALRQEGPQQEREHELKTWPDYFAAIESGVKTFEVRKDDRDFYVGDVLILHEWDPDTATYSGRSVRRVVSYILTRFAGIESGYVCMALSASRTAQAPQQEDEIAVGQIWSAPDGRQLRVAGLAESQARIAMRNVESNRLTYMDRSNFDASQKWHLTRVSPSPELSAVRTDQTELRAAQARIRVLETSVDYLRYLVDHPVKQWLPIATAPTGEVLLYRPQMPPLERITVRRANDWCGEKCCPSARPTHWIPIPDPPVAPAEGEK